MFLSFLSGINRLSPGFRIQGVRFFSFKPLLLPSSQIGSSTLNRDHFVGSAAILGLFLEPNGLPRFDLGLGAT